MSFHRPEPAAARAVPDNPAIAQETPCAHAPAVNPENPIATAESAAAPPATERVRAEPPSALPVTPPAKASSDQEPAPGLSPAIMLENMRRVFRQYGSRFGGNPVGTNREITSPSTVKTPDTWCS